MDDLHTPSETPPVNTVSHKHISLWSYFSFLELMSPLLHFSTKGNFALVMEMNLSFEQIKHIKSSLEVWKHFPQFSH